jgi:hypothetical protein
MSSTFTETTALRSLAENVASSTDKELPDTSILPDLIEDAALPFMLRTTSEMRSTKREE